VTTTIRIATSGKLGAALAALALRDMSHAAAPPAATAKSPASARRRVQVIIAFPFHPSGCMNPIYAVSRARLVRQCIQM